MEKKTRQSKCTSRQKVYNFIVDYIQENGYAPSVREISIGTNLSSTSSVYYLLQRLEDEGRIEMKRGYSPRAIKLVGYEFRKVER